MFVVLRWTGLGGGEIDTWAHQDLFVSPYRVAPADRAESLVSVPLATTDEDLVPFVETALRPLFGVFWWVPGSGVIQSALGEALAPAPGTGQARR